jgi:hypothetical protein
MQVGSTARRRGRGALGAVVALAGLAGAGGTARAAGDCITSYEASQVARKAGHLREARAAALACGQSSCPGRMAKECSAWVLELDRLTPSVVLSFQRPDGSDAVGARVTIDGRPTPLDGLAVPLDPGPHTVRVELAGLDTLEQKILVQEGEQRRRITGRLAAPAEGRPPPAPAVSRTPAIVMVSVAAVALGLGVGFGSAALVEYEHLSGSCAPGCSPDEAGQVRQRAVVADVSFAVSLVSLATAAGLFFRPVPHAPVSLVPVALPARGGGLRLEAAFP